MKVLHPKILEAKRRSPYIMRSSVVSTDDYAKPEEFLSLLDQRKVRGYSSIWSSKNDYGEMFRKGAWKRSIDLRGPQSKANQKIKFFRQHNQADPLALLDVLEEDELGLFFETAALDPVDSADRVLIQLRSGTLNNFSNGFNPVWERAEYDEKSDTIWYAEANLHELSVVGLASDHATFAIRSKAELDEAQIELSDEVEYFIRSLRRDIQLEARNLFARQKSLYESNSQFALARGETVKKSKIDYSYLVNNFKS
jgi:Escherichia/Staphylococcus phage prohead protease